MARRARFTPETGGAPGSCVACRSADLKSWLCEPAEPTPTPSDGPGNPGQPRGARLAAQPVPAAPPPNALFAEMLRAARELLAIRSPLDAELMVSELLGTWWGQSSPRRGTTPRRRQADVEEADRRGPGDVRRAAGQPGCAGPAVRGGLPGHRAAGVAGRAGRAGPDGHGGGPAGLGRARRRGEGGRLLRELRAARRHRRGRLRVQLRRRGAARAGHGRRLQRGRDGHATAG